MSKGAVLVIVRGVSYEGEEMANIFAPLYVLSTAVE